MTFTEIIRGLGQKYDLVGISFEKIFRNIALKKPIDSKFVGKVFISSDEYDSIIQYKREFSSLFFEEDSFWLLWVCRCLYYKNNVSVLSLMNEYIAKVCKITRGNLNTYKLNGWDVHILYVYQLANYNFANNIIPNAYLWKFDVKHIFTYFQNLYKNLSPNAQFILKVGSFLHDIGVTLGVKDHEEKGISLTRQYYTELHIDDEQYKQLGVTLNKEEIIVAIRAIVGNHQIINQISAEVSDKYIFEKIENIKISFSFSEHLLELYNQDFVGIMSILAISDMMAVDDSLLSEEKFCELKDAYVFLNNIIKFGNYRRDPSIYGIKRLVSLLKDEFKISAHCTIAEILQKKCSNGNEIIDFLYNVKFLSYAMAAIKPLGNIEQSIRLIEVCVEIYKQSNISLQELVIKFDPDINNTKLKIILDELPKYIVANGLLNFSINNEISTIEISC